MPKRNGILSALGLNVRQQREAKQLTQEKLAELANLDPTYISDIERGLRNPGIKNVARLVKAAAESEGPSPMPIAAGDLSAVRD